MFFLLKKLRSLPQRAQQNPRRTGTVLLSFDFDSDYHSTGSIVTVVPATASTISAAAHDVRLPEVTSAVSASAAAPLVVAAIAASFPTVVVSPRVILVVSGGATPVAALVVMVVVPLLLALNAHVRHDHLGTVPHGHAVPRVVPAATVRCQVLPGSVDKKSVRVCCV